MLTRTADGSVLDSTGKVIYFSVDRFVNDIALGDCCFICGAARNVKPFNDEHVVPDWLLGRYALHSRTIGLPNGTEFRYDRYKVPCCVDCNSLMGREIEEPVSRIATQGHANVARWVKTEGPWLLFLWTALIFLKTHLKDKEFRFHRDLRQEDGKIADAYAWENLHHLHCLARSFYTRCDISSDVLGTFLVLPARQEDYFEPFDYGDLYLAQSMLLRLDNVAFVIVFNDSCGVANIYSDELRRISAPLSPIQLREVLVRCGYINVLLEERPMFASSFDPLAAHCQVEAKVPRTVRTMQGSNQQFGMLMHSKVGHLLRGLPSPQREIIGQHVLDGRWTSLFDESGKFIENSMQPSEEERPAPEQ